MEEALKKIRHAFRTRNFKEIDEIVRSFSHSQAFVRALGQMVESFEVEKEKRCAGRRKRREEKLERRRQTRRQNRKKKRQKESERA